jgi:hypothetical protein
MLVGASAIAKPHVQGERCSVVVAVEAGGTYADETNTRQKIREQGGPMSRFYVRAPGVNAVRKALGRAPGGARVVGRYDRETIECRHTMEPHSLDRFWPILISRLAKAGLSVVERPGERDDDQLTKRSS